MRFMILVKATKDSEAGFVLNEQNKQMLTEMGKFNEELVKAGILLAADGLHTRVPKACASGFPARGARSLTARSPKRRSWSRASCSGSASRARGD